MRNIEIRAVLNGFVVSVGCQTVVFNDPQAMLAELASYLTNPEATEKRFREHPNARWTLLNGGPTPTVNQAAERDYDGPRTTTIENHVARNHAEAASYRATSGPLR